MPTSALFHRPPAVRSPVVLLVALALPLIVVTFLASFEQGAPPRPVVTPEPEWREAATVAPSSQSPSTTTAAPLGLSVDRLLPVASVRLPPLPVHPTFTRMCSALPGVVSGLTRAGFVHNDSANLSSILIPCNSRLLAPVLVKEYLGVKLITNIIGVVKNYCLGSQKTRQLACRRELAALDGCADYNALGVQPAQFFLPAECPAMLARNASLLIKPADGFHGAGIEYFPRPPNLTYCQTRTSSIGQLYVTNPALLTGGKKFDVRTWVLVAHVDPLVVFHADGFARVSARAFSIADEDPMAHITNAHGQEATSGHFRTFDSLPGELAAAYGWPADYFARTFREHVDKAVRLAVLAQFKTSFGAFAHKPRAGIMHVFAADWVIDTAGKAHLLELNGLPDQGFKVPGDNLRWTDMMALVLMLHWELDRIFDPARDAGTVARAGVWQRGAKVVGDALRANAFRFGAWRLVYNEREVPFDRVNVCDEYGQR